MAQKSYPAWQWMAATALALVLGVTYTFVLFQPLLGQVMLVVAAYLGWRSWKGAPVGEARGLISSVRDPRRLLRRA